MIREQDDREEQEARSNLAGVKVLEFSCHPGGSLSCSMLACMGADVILVEVGRACRRTDAADRRREQYGRGKSLLALNLDHPDTTSILHRVVRRIDVVVSDLGVTAARALGLDYPTLASVNAGLIYVEGEREGATSPALQLPFWADPAHRN